MKKTFFKKVMGILLVLILILSVLPLLSFSAAPARESGNFLVSGDVDLKAPAKPGVTSTTAPNTSTTSSEQTFQGEFIFIDASGTGDFADIIEAIDNASSGSTIIMDAGTYEVPADFEISKSINIIGKGPDKTIIIGEEGDSVVFFSSGNKSFVEGIAFTRKGNIPGNIIFVEDSDVSFNNCIFSGGKPDPDSQNWGSGLIYIGSSGGTISNCIVESNAFCGITIEDESSLLVINNIFRKNASSGISYYGSSGGYAIKNECYLNVSDGIQVQSDSAPTLISNNLHDNKLDGIAYYDNAGGLAFQNTCSKNQWGIYVSANATPFLEANILKNNTEEDFLQE
ncbi:MAG: right-handed parallel beta-helix repeat-containing protein [bacterium]